MVLLLLLLLFTRNVRMRDAATFCETTRFSATQETSKGKEEKMPITQRRPPWRFAQKPSGGDGTQEPAPPIPPPPPLLLLNIRTFITSKTCSPAAAKFRMSNCHCATTSFL